MKPCCERDTNHDGNCDRHPYGLREPYLSLTSGGVYYVDETGRASFHATVKVGALPDLLEACRNAAEHLGMRYVEGFNFVTKTDADIFNALQAAIAKAGVK